LNLDIVIYSLGFGAWGLIGVWDLVIGHWGLVSVFLYAIFFLRALLL